jgi:betaine lipid synthase
MAEAAEVTIEVRSKAYQSAIINLSAKLPLPSTFYQNTHQRIYYDESLPKHTQFGNEFIYAFTWEDSRVDQRLLKIGPSDVILCLTSAGDNLLDYLVSANPRRIHAVDLNPNQNHLLELKLAAYQALPYVDFWKLFGRGRHSGFREILISRLSPYMSSQAYQFWLCNTSIFTSSRGLYERGGSGHGIKLIKWIFWLSGLSSNVTKLYEAKTLNEQREIWPRIRRVLLSRPLHWAVIGSKFLWKAAGVPPAQISMIQQDYLDQETLNPLQITLADTSGEAMWQYLINTLDPVARETLLSEDNFYYLLTLTGHYTRRSV